MSGLIARCLLALSDAGGARTELQEAQHLLSDLCDEGAALLSVTIEQSFAVLELHCGDAKAAEAHLKVALELGDHLPTSPKTLSLRVQLLSLNSQLRRRAGELDAALELAQEAFTLCEALDDPILHGRLHQSVALTHEQLMDSPRALEHTVKAVELARLQGNEALLGLRLMNQSVYQRNVGDIDTAIESLAESEALLRSAGERDHLIAVLINRIELAVFEDRPQLLTEALGPLSLALQQLSNPAMGARALHELERVANEASKRPSVSASAASLLELIAKLSAAPPQDKPADASPNPR